MDQARGETMSMLSQFEKSYHAFIVPNTLVQTGWPSSSFGIESTVFAQNRFKPITMARFPFLSFPIPTETTASLFINSLSYFLLTSWILDMLNILLSILIPHLSFAGIAHDNVELFLGAKRQLG